MLQSGFFSVKPFNPYPYWNGDVLFEQANPGTYTYTFQYKTKCGIVCVAGGNGGFCAKTGIKINEGSPSETVFSGLQSFSGGSGGYSYLERTFNKGDTLVLNVGRGGNAYISTNIYGSVSQNHPSVTITDCSGTSSSVIFNSSLLVSAGAPTAGRFFLSNPNDPNTYSAEPSYGGTGSTINGNNGTVGGNSANGGNSVYEVYGSGGSAGYTGDNQTGTPWANNGGNGYIKIYAVMPS